MGRGVVALVVCLRFMVCLAEGLETSEKQLHIVYLGSNRDLDVETTTGRHHDILATALGSYAAVQSSMVYSYRHGFSGFSAMLSAGELATISGMPEVVSVFRSRGKKLHTTRSWDFLGLKPRNETSPAAQSGQDTIIGVLDTGVWPESESFNDASLGPVPARWKGACIPGQNFTATNCNKKLVGARYYLKGYEVTYGALNGSNNFRSARDSQGHGTHTISTTGGSLVEGASVEGLAKGNARGGVPGGRLASYKVCWPLDCTDADILAAFDDAIRDGVDVLSLSLGMPPADYLKDSIAIGSFHAIQKGIVVVCSAGNSGPLLATSTNLAPWIITVAASTIDRQFQANIDLGNKAKYQGQSTSAVKLHQYSYPLRYGGDIPAINSTIYKSSHCGEGSLNTAKARGSIVLCYIGTSFPDLTVSEAGGVAVIVIDEEFKSIAFAFASPAAIVGNVVGDEILSYINSTRHPTAAFKAATTVFGGPAPLAASFSSRGPNALAADILKPDLTAPGVDILAAWSPLAPPSGEPQDSRAFSFNILSGTSMACPHVSGAAALLKSLHPDWSPAAIKSALMTTATALDMQYPDNSDGYLAFGSGQINPSAAADPGLVYDTSPSDYASFLCAVGYNTSTLQQVTGDNSVCPSLPPPVNHLNYPSISVSELSKTTHVVRTLTNVGTAHALYTVSIEPPPGVNVTVSPTKLAFTTLQQQLSYTANIRPGNLSATDWVFGSVTWSDGSHVVRSPIAVGPSYSSDS